MGNLTPPTLAELLFREAHRFDFFQVVRLLESLAAAGQGPRREPVGEDHAPEREVVRFRALAALGFPPGSVSLLRQAKAAGPPEMVVSFLGVTGPGGVLPQHYTALLVRRLRARDYTLRDFFDLFNHRAVSLFYRAWQKYRLPFAYEGARRASDEMDLVTLALYCLTGFGGGHLRGCLQVEDEAFLYYGGHFAHFPRAASALEGLLSDYFQMPVEVQQFQGQWLALEEEDLTRMPSRADPRGRTNRLGVNALAGRRVWDVQSKFRLRVGPLRYAQFRRFLPSSFGLRPLGQMTRTYAGPELEFDVQLVLLAEEVPRARLASHGPDRSHLGWNAWLRARPAKKNADDAIFRWTD